MKKIKLMRITTVSATLEVLLKNQLRFMNQFFEVVAVSNPDAVLDKFKVEDDIRTIELKMTRKITPLQDFISVLQMIKIFINEKPDIVHSHTPKAGLVSMLAAYITRVPNRLHTVAGLPLMEATGFKRKILLLVEKLIYACATNIYPNSQGLEDFILNNHLTTKEKLKVIGNGSSDGIDTNHFKVKKEILEIGENVRNKYNIHKDDFIFIFVGRIVTDKGINELLVAFDKLTKKRKNIKLLLVGAMEEMLDPILNESKDILKNNEKIIQVGFQKDVRPFFVISDCLVFPSYREGFPSVVMQAGAMGIPSIVSDINGCNEIIENGVNGLIIPSKDLNLLYDAMYKVLNNNQLKISLSKDARKLIVNRYSQSFVWEAIKKEYVDIIK